MQTYYAGFIPYDGKISVLFPDLPGCTTWGDSMEHAFVMARDALASHMEALANDNDPIPAPSSQERATTELRKLYAAFDIGELPENVFVQPVSISEREVPAKHKAISVKQSTQKTAARNEVWSRAGLASA